MFTGKCDLNYNFASGARKCKTFGAFLQVSSFLNSILRQLQCLQYIVAHIPTP